MFKLSTDIALNFSVSIETFSAVVWWPNKTIPVINSLSSKINIVFRQYPEYSRGQTDNAKTVAKMLEIVEEEYSVGSGDDDYFIPKSLDKCVNFLENNQEYSSAHGYGTLLANNESEGKLIIGGRYILKDCKADSASERVKIFSKLYSQGWCPVSIS